MGLPTGCRCGANADGWTREITGAPTAVLCVAIHDNRGGVCILIPIALSRNCGEAISPAVVLLALHPNRSKPMPPIRALIYDLEIKRAIPDKHGASIPGIKYCAGWHDHAAM